MKPAAPRAGRPRNDPWRRWVCPPIALLSATTGLTAADNAFGADLYPIEASVPARVLATGYFGSHLHRLVKLAEPNATTTAWPAGQIAALRLWDTTTRWADLEPAPGVFRFERLDAYVAQAEANHASLLMVLGSPPRWASARPDEAGPYGPGSAAEPADLDRWERYVAALARRYKGRIAQYELWNEPYFSDLPADRGQPGAFYTGSLASMVQLARRTRAVLDREDPRAELLSPGFVGAVQRLEMFLDAGGARYVDGVAYHFYTETERGFITLHRDVRAALSRRGLSHLPLYNTETGFAARDSAVPVDRSMALPDRETAAALLARSLLLGAFLGVERYYQYAWDNERSGMVLARLLEATPSAAAFAAVRRWLVGTTLNGCHAAPVNVVTCEGQRNGERLLIGWQAKGGQPSTLQVPAFARIATAEYAVNRRPIDLKNLRENGLPVGIDPVAVWWRPSRETPRP